MAFGKGRGSGGYDDEDQRLRDRADAEKFRTRRKRQAGYQRKHRKKLFLADIPERGNIADAALTVMLNVSAEAEKGSTEANLAKWFFGRLVEQLANAGFDPDQSRAVYTRMVQRLIDAQTAEQREAEAEEAYRRKLLQETFAD